MQFEFGAGGSLIATLHKEIKSLDNDGSKQATKTDHAPVSLNRGFFI